MICIPEHYIELEHIYSATLARDIKSLAVVSTVPGEGVSSIILSLAKRNVLAGRTTLVVDFNIYNPALSALATIDNESDSERNRENNNESKSTCYDQLASPSTLPQINGNGDIAIISVPIARELVLGLREPGVLHTHIQKWLKEYDNVLIDTSPMSLTNGANLPPEYISSACDGTVLAVLAGHTTNTALAHTLNQLNKAQAQLIGIVINDQFNPSLKNELLREVQRIEKTWPTLARKLHHWINSIKFLDLEI